MPCEINSILKLTPGQGYPDKLKVDNYYRSKKSGYRVIPVGVPIPLVDENWLAHADVIIRRLTWEDDETYILFKVVRIYDNAFVVKEINNEDCTD